MFDFVQIFSYSSFLFELAEILGFILIRLNEIYFSNLLVGLLVYKTL